MISSDVWKNIHNGIPEVNEIVANPIPGKKDAVMR